MGIRSFGRSLERKFAREDDAASLAEYALLLGVVAVALLVVVSQFSGSVSNLFARTTNTVAQVSADGGTGGGDLGTGTGTTTGPGNSSSTPNGGGNGQGGGNNGKGLGNGGPNGK